MKQLDWWSPGADLENRPKRGRLPESVHPPGLDSFLSQTAVHAVHPPPSCPRRRTPASTSTSYSIMRELGPVPADRGHLAVAAAAAVARREGTLVRTATRPSRTPTTWRSILREYPAPSPRYTPRHLRFSLGFLLTWSGCCTALSMRSRRASDAICATRRLARRVRSGFFFWLNALKCMLTRLSVLRAFFLEGNLSKHKRSVHLNERPFKCPHCPKVRYSLYRTVCA